MCKACYHYKNIKKALFDDHVPEVSNKLIDECDVRGKPPMVTFQVCLQTSESESERMTSYHTETDDVMRSKPTSTREYKSP